MQWVLLIVLFFHMSPPIEDVVALCRLVLQLSALLKTAVRSQRTNRIDRESITLPLGKKRGISPSAICKKQFSDCGRKTAKLEYMIG